MLGLEIPSDLQGDIYEMKEKKGSLQLTLQSSLPKNGDGNEAFPYDELSLN